MEMGMAAMEDIDIAQDITPPISPLSFSLYDSLLHSHCSSCFSPLPPFPHNSHSIPTPLYCSPLCSASHSPLHFSSAEHLLLLQSPHSDTSDLRAALRFLQSHRASSVHSGRVARLLVNREKLTSPEGPDDDDDELCERIRVGARAMAAAIKTQRGGEDSDDVVLEEATVALCLVLTNAVEVQDNSGRSLGIAVYDSSFCYINHSCSPNACYRFVLSPPNSPPVASRGKPKLRITPFIRHLQDRQIDSGNEIESCSGNELAKEEKQGYGPKIIVRSIKRIMKGEEVFVTYTDLLQPKATRQLELRSKYRFICCCERCSTLPFTYVDHALQAISAVNLDSSGLSSCSLVSRDKAVRLTEYIDEVISEYLSDSAGDPESCCKKLEYILGQGLKEDEEQSQSSFKLHPLHHLSLNAYTTLASAYKVRATSLFSDVDENQSEAFDMSRTSTAYSLLLANATHHLFRSESSLIASVANFWMDAGESLLCLSRMGMVVSNLPSLSKFECSNCSLVNRFRVCASNVQIKSADYEIVSNNIHFNSNDMGSSDESGGSIGIVTEHGGEHIFQLGVHCLAYGGELIRKDVSAPVIGIGISEYEAKS
ncbi:protein SET DOMAIN GROUP 41 [Senna tora]|uniref:Protein SET DOMAIN GROUP 41 n=1 Tax=Senna tora TaxID=362788 RepID=A0A834SX80_9FABA|nr:protein SET DOMAIN GROUP 41 [Senna tora]